MTQTEIIKSSYDGPYLYRPGIGYRELTLALLEQPESPLDEETREAFYEYEHQLNAAKIRNQRSIGEILEAIKGDDSEAPIVFARAFVDSEIDLSNYQAPHFQDITDVVRWIADSIEKGLINNQDLAVLARKSRDLYERDMAEAVREEIRCTDSQIEHARFVISPELLLRNLADLFEAREILKNELIIYKSNDDQLSLSKNAILEVYLARVNELIADCIPRIGYLYDQAKICRDVQTIDNIKKFFPESIYEVIKNPQARKRHLKRLDYLRNGLSGYETDASLLEKNNFSASESEGNAAKAIFTPRERERMLEYELEPQVIKELIERALLEYNLLSSEPSSTWSPARRHRTEDEKYQVVIDPNANSFLVDFVSGVYKIPPKNRSLYDILTVAFSHELTHINQAEAERALSERLKICKNKTKRISILRESGANTTQRHIERQCFGVPKPFAFTYTAALRALESGGSLYDATLAFYHAKLDAFPGISPRTAAIEASNRVMRLLRGGGYNSQSLAYSEEAVIDSELEGLSLQEKARATLITNIDLVDQLRLHRFGLLPQPDLEPVNWVDYIMHRIVPLFKSLIEESDEGSKKN